MPSKKKSSNSMNKIPSAENKIHRNKKINGYKLWKTKANNILLKKKEKNASKRKGVPLGPDTWKQSNIMTAKRHKSLLQRNNLRRFVTNLNISKRNVRTSEYKNLIKKTQQNRINKSLSKKSKKFQPKPSQLGKKSSNSNKAKDLVKMQKNRESKLNNNRRNYDFVNNAPTPKEAAAAAAAANQPSMFGNIISGVSKLFQRSP